jgi:hypothetical protein
VNPVVGEGTYYLACNSLYFISELKVTILQPHKMHFDEIYILQATLAEAKAECCRRNMSLLAIETDAEHDCIATNIFKSLQFYP